MRRLTFLLAAATCAAGCIFGGGGLTDDDASTTDTSRPDGGGADVSTSDVGDAGSSDIGRPDLDPPADMDPADMPDGGMMPPYTFVPLRAASVALPVRPEYLPLGSGSNLGAPVVAMLAHWRIAWGTELEAVDATTAGLPSASFAILSTEANQDPLNLTPQDDDLDGTPWANPSMPLLVVRASLFNNTFLMDGDTFQPVNPLLRVENAADPLALGLPADFRPYVTSSGAEVVSRTIRTVGSEPIVLRAANGDAFPALLGVEFGTPFENGDAAARRVALGVEAADDYAWEGWTIFDNAVAWLTNNPFPPPRGHCVVIGLPNEGMREHLAARARRNGCDISFSPNQIDDATVVIVAPGVTGSALGDLRQHSGPIVTIFSATDVLSSLGLSSANAPTPSMSAYWSMNMDAPPWLRANQSGDVLVQELPSALPVASGLAPGATVIATVLDTNSPAFFVVEAGADLIGGAEAPGDRVAIGLSAVNLTRATNPGSSMFDAAVQWSLQRAEGM